VQGVLTFIYTPKLRILLEFREEQAKNIIKSMSLGNTMCKCECKKKKFENYVVEQNADYIKTKYDRYINYKYLTNVFLEIGTLTSAVNCVLYPGGVYCIESFDTENEAKVFITEMLEWISERT
jgi:hypothetical protein